MKWKLVQLAGLLLTGGAAACPGAEPGDGRVTLPKTDCHWETDPQNPATKTLVCSAPQDHTGGDTTGISGGGH